MSVAANEIERHRTAMGRSALSRPLSLALQDGLISTDTSVFDYGCGRGGDVVRLRALGIQSKGWDPAYFPHNPVSRADIVNLGFVINVIEDRSERIDTLRKAWDLASSVLVVSARLKWEEGFLGPATRFSDGVLTTRSTFQRLFTQEELRDWIEAILGIKPLAAAPGVFYVFREEHAAQAFLAARFRRRPTAAPRPVISQALYETHRSLLESLMQFIGTRGRVPEDAEFAESPEVRKHFGSFTRAFSVIRAVTGEEHWNRIREERSQDLLVYLALARFGQRPNFSRLPAGLQADVKAFCGAYTRACNGADELLFSVGKPAVIDQACRQSPVGKLTPDGLYVHVSAIPRLPPVLRVYEGCARTLTGSVEDATVIKLNRQKPKISYLSYPDFDRSPHPALQSVVGASLQQLRVDFRDFRKAANPPILHRKEAFVAEDYLLRAKFARLTEQEEKWGLYAQAHTIGTREGWEEALRRCGARQVGHRLVRV